MHSSIGTVTLLAGADIGPVVGPVDQFAEKILPVLQGADLRFAQCERTYSNLGVSPQFALGPSGQHSRLDPDKASIFKTAMIDIVSMASNHALDWGPKAMLDTIKLFRSMGIQVLGAGKDEAEARNPVIVEQKGIKIAFLSYCSVLRDGQAAGTDKPGVAPCGYTLTMNRKTFSQERIQRSLPSLMRKIYCVFKKIFRKINKALT